MRREEKKIVGVVLPALIIPFTSGGWKKTGI